MLEGDPQGPIPSVVGTTDPLIGRVLNDRFRILAPLGSGGMGKVYKAVQTPLDRVVALKILNPNFPAEKDPAFKRRFFLEASLTSKLRHPNTVTVIDYGQTEDGIYFIAMEYMEGQTLAEVLAHEKTLPWRRVLDIAQQICRSLREAHKLGVIHRDLKPANVMLLNEADHDVVKVLDFGLVKSFLAADCAGQRSRGDPERRLPGEPPVHGARSRPGTWPTRGATSTRSGSWSTRCSPAGRRSRARTTWRSSSST